MPLAVVASRALLGMQAPAVQVEVHLSGGLPGFCIVGLPDTEVREARERVRSALLNSSLPYPSARRIVVNLAPADLPKESGRFDLPIALGLLAAQGAIDPLRLQGHEFAGELSLAGELRPVHGALAMTCAARASRAAGTRLVLPLPSACEAALAAPDAVLGARHLHDVLAYLGGQLDAAALRAPVVAPAPAPVTDLADVRGQAQARRALEIAAAGEHHLLLVGPPGSGKSMMARRLVGVLPPLEHDQALESAAMLSLSGAFEASAWGRRSLRSPHHGCSAAALLGGLGSGGLRPGEVSLAHHGVLFLDELPEFDRRALEGLREPLEMARVHLARAAQRAEFPARFLLVAAMNPCPCGHLGHPGRACRCSAEQIARYRARLSGPLLDRIDLRVEVAALAPDALLELPAGEASAAVAQRVQRAALRQRQRQGRPNAALGAAELERHCALRTEARSWLGTTLTRLGSSARATHRILRVARSIADLCEAAHVEREHLAEAMQLRRALGAD